MKLLRSIALALAALFGVAAFTGCGDKSAATTTDSKKTTWKCSSPT